MVIIFDLDDTLYEEQTFVYSGIKAVSLFLAPILEHPAETLEREILVAFAETRLHLFDRVLACYGKAHHKLIHGCVQVYRRHKPNIALYPEAICCLEELSRCHPLYVVTDGNHWVQRRKFTALGLSRFIRRAFFTYAHGQKRSKPSPYCFEKICQSEGVEPQRAVYIGDNPYKDFLGIKPLGFHTIRILTGPYRSVTVEPAMEAELSLSSLASLSEKWLTSQWPQWNTR